MSNDPEETVPPEFYELVERFTDLADEISVAHDPAKLSAVILYAAAQFNARTLVTLEDETRAAAQDYFVDQYRAMLEENLEALLEEQDEPRS